MQHLLPKKQTLSSQLFPRVMFCSILAQTRLRQQIVSPKRHDINLAYIFTCLCITMATIVLIMESQNGNLYIRWSSVFPVDKILISHWRKALYLSFPCRLDFILGFNRQLLCSRSELGGAAAGWRAAGWWPGGRCTDRPVPEAAWHRGASWA